MVFGNCNLSDTMPCNIWDLSLEQFSAEPGPEALSAVPHLSRRIAYFSSVPAQNRFSAVPQQAFSAVPAQTFQPSQHNFSAVPQKTFSAVPA